MQSEPTSAERLCAAVDGAVWVRYDKPHKLLFVGRETSDGWWVLTYDRDTGESDDNPWPVAPELVLLMGYRAAFTAAVTERLDRGY